MAPGTLYTYPDNFRAYKILIAAQYSGANVKVSSDFVFGETNKSEQFLKKFPLGKVPAFESDDGKVLLTESNAIAYHVANKQLRGSTPVDEALVLQWLGIADSEVLPASCTWVFPLLGLMPDNEEATARAKKDISSTLNALNVHLLSRTYLVGERITLADICMACTLLHLYQYALDPSFRKSYQNVNRWFTTIINQPQVKSVVGQVKLCDKPAKFDTKKFGEVQAQITGAQPQQGQKKEKKEKKAKAEPAEEPPAVAAAAEEPDETELALAAEPMSKDPFSELPKGTWNMDDFKRSYSNEDVEKSIPYFWEKFDPVNNSIWYAEYKYPNELTKVFMSCNLISGMYQRLEKMRKNAFASVCLFGKDGDSTISGIWIWKGHDLAFELSPDWQIDYESYEWKKLDASDEKTKKLVNDYLSWTGEDKKGRKFNQGKIFK